MFGPGERIEVDYTWNQSYCQSLAWSRMEHNQTRTFSVMVPKDATILEHGVKVRDGNDGSRGINVICKKTPVAKAWVRLVTFQ